MQSDVPLPEQRQGLTKEGKGRVIQPILVLKFLLKLLFSILYNSILNISTLNNVTASSGTAISTNFAVLTCSEILSKIRSNLTWHSNMLKMKYLPKKHPRKSEIAARDEREPETTRETSPAYTEHGIVSISRRLPLLQ